MECLFCKIVAGEIPSETVFEDEECLAFGDVNPQAPIHLLVIPKKHVASVNDLAESDDRLTGKLVRVARTLAQEKGIDESGYRLVLNCNSDGGQTVFHLHLHLLGGRRLRWPPG